MKSRHRMLDRDKITTFPIRERKNLVRVSDFATPLEDAGTLSGFSTSLPNILAARDLLKLVNSIVEAHRREKNIIVMMGGHVIKTGLAPLLIEMVEVGVVKCVAMGGAAAIHDFEIALFGETSEDVQENILDGSFGMVEETGKLMSECTERAVREGLGLGESLGKYLNDEGAANAGVSILARGYKKEIPITVHVAIGTDIVHQHPACSGAATGEATYRDFLVFAEVVRNITGGVVLNLGSAVIMPEVFLKALSMAQNIGELGSFTTADFDMLAHYRPTQNVVKRPARVGGSGYSFRGHHEIMIPLLVGLIKAKLS